MVIIRNLINNDYVYYTLIVIAIIIGVNIISKFIQNLFLLIKNFKIILYYLKKLILFLLKMIVKTIFFPFTFYGWYKEYREYSSYIINTSELRDEVY